jgi:hypothetical protein
MRHFTSGDDCAMAGEATAVTAAPAAETFKKSRRFIQYLLGWGCIPDFRRAACPGWFRVTGGALAGRL